LLTALVVSLTAFIPGNAVGIGALATSATGFSTTIGLTILSIWRWPGIRHLIDLAAIPLLGAAYVVQFINGLHLPSMPDGSTALRTQAILVIVFFLIAIGRAWQLIGGRERGITGGGKAAQDWAARRRPQAPCQPGCLPRWPLAH
jgi:hypothetical protein